MHTCVCHMAPKPGKMVIAFHSCKNHLHCKARSEQQEMLFELHGAMKSWGISDAQVATGVPRNLRSFGLQKLRHSVSMGPFPPGEPNLETDDVSNALSGPEGISFVFFGKSAGPALSNSIKTGGLSSQGRLPD